MFLSKLRIYIYNVLVQFYPWLYRHFYGMNIGKGCLISRKATLDRGINPKGIHIGEYTRITGGVLIMAHDACRSLKAETHIGSYCFIGARSIIMPGVKIGDQVIIGSGSVVTKDIPSNSIAVGNPARVIKSCVILGKYGVLINK